MCVVEVYTVFVVEVVVVDVVFNGEGRVLVTPTERRWTALYLAPNNIMTPSRVTRVLRSRALKVSHLVNTQMSSTKTFHWTTPFLDAEHEHNATQDDARYALIILNQPFPLSLLRALWNASAWHCCADGGANRLHDILGASGSDLTKR